MALLAVIGSVIVAFGPFTDPVAWQFDGDLDFGRLQSCLERDTSFGKFSSAGAYRYGGRAILAETGEIIVIDGMDSGLAVRSRTSLSDAQLAALDRCTRLN